MHSRRRILTACIAAAVAGAPIAAAAQQACVTSSNVSTVAGNLNNPRGLKFGSDGALYVAEGGRGGAHMNSVCDPLQPGPPEGRVVRVELE